MQSPPHKPNHSFANLFPSIHKQPPTTTTSPSSHPPPTFQLNNQGCKCQLCQKIIIAENLQILSQTHNDLQSQQFSKDQTKEYYIRMIEEICDKWKYKRQIRFCLPEVCLFREARPWALVEKKKEGGAITISKSKSRLHFFEIQNFFLTSFIAHSPTKKPRQSKNQAICKPYINECIIFAKYEGNCYRMMTYRQIETIFQSKNKSMKDGLMYLQTLVGGDVFQYRTINVRLDDVEHSEEMKALFERAKAEVRVVCGEIKLTDVEYFEESEEIQFENDLKAYDTNRYLLYLSYKIILTSSKTNPQIIKNAIFKYAIVNQKVFLFDLRVKEFGSCLKYWSSNVLQALEIKLKKTMSLMELEKSEKEERFKIFENQLSTKARNLSEWLKASTEDDWEEIMTIRRRLEKLQEEKKSLEKSRKEQEMRKSFKMRNIQNKRIRENSGVKHNLSMNM